MSRFLCSPCRTSALSPRTEWTEGGSRRNYMGLETNVKRETTEEAQYETIHGGLLKGSEGGVRSSQVPPVAPIVHIFRCTGRAHMNFNPPSFCPAATRILPTYTFCALLASNEHRRTPPCKMTTGSRARPSSSSSAFVFYFGGGLRRFVAQSGSSSFQFLQVCTPLPCSSSPHLLIVTRVATK
jgi:hypothetical protein